MNTSFRDWEGVPPLIVHLMASKLDRLSNYVCFSGVCSQWRYVALESNVNYKTNLDLRKASPKNIPMLMYRTNDNSEDGRDLYSVLDKITYTVKLPLPYKYRFVGSALGWLFCVEETMVVTLVNPYNDSCISLPVFKNPRKLFLWWHRSHFDFYIRKGILLSDPHASPDSFVVVVIYDIMGKLAFFKSGDPCWNFIDSKLILWDIIYYESNLYGATREGQFVQIDLHSRTINSIVSATDFNGNSMCLVESQDGDLLMVQRWYLFGDYNTDDAGSEAHFLDEDDVNIYDFTTDVEIDSSDSEAESIETRHPMDLALAEAHALEGQPNTYMFKVFRMTHPIVEETASWVEIKNIGEQAFFVGDNHAVSVSTNKFPGFLSNSIYYTSEHHNDVFPYAYRGLDEDSGIFNLEHGGFSKYHVLGSSNKYMQPPIWFVPNPQEIS